VGAAVGAQEEVPAASIVPGGAGAPLPCVLACLGGQQPGEEGRATMPRWPAAGRPVWVAAGEGPRRGYPPLRSPWHLPL